MLDRRMKIVLSLLPKGKKVLDVGCGNGTLTYYVARDNNTIGIDISKEKISIARKRHPEVKFEIADIDKYKTKDKFDVIILAGVIEYLENPGKTLKKIKNFLKKDGFLIITVPNVLSLRKRIRKFLRMRVETDDRVKHLFTKEEIVNLMRKAGYTIDFLTTTKMAKVKNIPIPVIDGLADNIILKCKKCG
jgi:2-polyprenyl-3-methyl-5-hydroxy-6-metoxy-1,4-benzoquinol methylase